MGRTRKTTSHPATPATVRSRENQKLAFGKEIATVLIGDDLVPYHVHRSLLVRSSDFFRLAFESSFKEKEGTVRIEDADPVAFPVYTTWLYSGKMCTQVDVPGALGAHPVASSTIPRKRSATHFDGESSSERDSPPSDYFDSDDESNNDYDDHNGFYAPQEPPTTTKLSSEARDAYKLEWALLCKCLILADLLQDHTFYDVTIDCLIESVIQAGNFFPIAYTAELYDQLPESFPALQFFVYIWVKRGKTSWMESASSGPAAFWLAVTRGLLAEAEAPRKRKPNAKAPWITDLRSTTIIGTL